MKRYWNYLLIFFLVLEGCCKEETPDPCANTPATSAEFNALGYLDGFNLKIACNANGQPISTTERRWTSMPYVHQNFTSIFAPVQKFDSVIWRVGADPRAFRADTLQIVFPDTGTVKITLVGYRKPDVRCNPLDNGIDTVQKEFKIYNNKEKFLQRFQGKFEGNEEGEPDRKRVIELHAFLDGAGDFTGFWIKNFPLTNDPFEESYGPPGIQLWGRHNIYYFFHENTLGTSGWIKIEDDGQITIDYSQVKPPFSNRCNRINKKFIGKKL